VVVLVDTDPLAHQVSRALGLLALEQQYALELEQLEPVRLVLFACSVPRLAAVAESLEPVIG
jgi:hypothetical protein